MKDRKFIRWRGFLLCAILVVGLFYTSYVHGNSLFDKNWRVESLLHRMSIEEKAGQVVVGFFRGPSFDDHIAEMIGSYQLGGVVLYSITGNIEDVEQVAGLVFDMQRHARKKENLPLFVAIDQEGGLVNRINKGVTVFPGNMALGATGDKELSREAARVTARELRILGINMNFAPVVDVNSEPANPIIGIRSFGSDPGLVAKMGQAMIIPYREEGVIATAKHFPGHGNTDIDSHYGLPLISQTLEELKTIELYPFRSMVEKGVPAVMSAHIEVPALEPVEGVPATLSESILEGLLRDQMGFEGVIVADSLGMGALDQHYGIVEAALSAFEAGCDILLFGADRGHEPEDQKEVIQALVDAVEAGRIKEERLDEAVRRIVTLKMNAGILHDPYPRFSDFSSLTALENVAVARRIAEKSVTLVRNYNELLPLPADGESIPVIWPEEFSGSLDVVLQSCPALKPYTLPLDSPKELIEPLLQELSHEPLIIAASYDLHRYGEWAEMLNVLSLDKTIVIALRSPYDLLYVPDATTYVATYGDRPVSLEALCRVLTGELEPVGKLPVDLPGFYESGWGMSYGRQ